LASTLSPIQKTKRKRKRKNCGTKREDDPLQIVVRVQAHQKRRERKKRRRKGPKKNQRRKGREVKKKIGKRANIILNTKNEESHNHLQMNKILLIQHWLEWDQNQSLKIMNQKKFQKILKISL
jgi:hypothetical protein